MDFMLVQVKLIIALLRTTTIIVEVYQTTSAVTIDLMRCLRIHRRSQLRLQVRHKLFSVKNDLRKHRVRPHNHALNHPLHIVLKLIRQLQILLRLLSVLRVNFPKRVHAVR